LVLSAGSVGRNDIFGQDPPLERPCIEGRVVDETDRPIPAADVFWIPIEVYPEERERPLHLVTSQDGRFNFEAPESFRVAADSDRIGRLWIVARGRALEVVPANDFRVRAGAARKESVRLPAPVPLTLRVVDPDRRAREGELVEPIHFNLPGEALRVNVPRAVGERLAGITDVNGEYPVTYLKRDGRIGFRVVSEKYGIQQQGGADLRGTDALVTFRLQPTARLEGETLGENKKTFAGLRLFFQSFNPYDTEVILGEVGGITFSASVVVGEDGRFEVPALGPGVLQVHCERGRKGGLSEPVIMAPADIAAGKTVSIMLASQPTTIFRGVVVTEGTNEPVAGAQVTISSGRNWTPAVAQTDAQGRYSITSFSRDSELRASGGVVECRDVVEVSASPGLKQVVCPPIKLPPTRKITGTVLNSAGQPVVDAEVEGLEVAIHHGKAKTSKDGRFEMLTAAERTITDYVVRLNGESRAITVRSREPLELVVDEPAKKQ
jgi:hypothetical protein